MTVAVIGSGPAGLMAAFELAQAGCAVTIFEKNKGPGHKLLIAGGSGLNISNAAPPAEFASQYEGDAISWINLFENFSVADWLTFIQRLGFETFEGTSDRYFVREMKASGLLRAWLQKLKSLGVNFQFEHRCAAFQKADKEITLTFEKGSPFKCDALLFATGGGSWLKEAAGWPQIFAGHQIQVKPFMAANAGFQISWSANFLAEAVNRPLKNIEFFSTRGKRKGDLMVTAYGIEGTPIYACGLSETCFVDLKPDLSASQIVRKLEGIRENLSPLRRAQKKLNLDSVALSLLFHETQPENLDTIEAISQTIKRFPLQLLQPRPLSEAISSTGGIALDEIDRDFMLRKLPGIFLAGEMLDWHAPTGGFLIQACVSQGFVAAQGILKYLGA